MTANETMLQIAVNALASDHDLTGFEPVQDADGQPNGYQARCRNCQQSVWVGDNGLMYSLLDDICNGEG